MKTAVAPAAAPTGFGQRIINRIKSRMGTVENFIFIHRPIYDSVYGLCNISGTAIYSVEFYLF